MAISKEENAFHCIEYKEKIMKFLQFDEKTLEFSFNEEMIIKNKWIYAAIDGSFLEKYEIHRIISLSRIEYFLCLNLDTLFGICPNDLIIYKFNNNLEDWIKILSPCKEYTLWNSLLFNMDNLIIIKPWSSGYNTLIAGEESVVRNICRDDYWMFNKKYPIYP